MSTQSTANTTLKALLTCLINQQQSQQAQLDAIRDAFKANKDEGTVIAKPAIFNGNVNDVTRFLPMFRNRATEQKALRIKAGEGGKAGCWAANYLKQINTSTTDKSVAFPFEGKWETYKKQFKVCFGSAKEKADAIWELEQMKQGNKAVTLYCQDFRDAGAKTGLLDANLMIRAERALEAEGFSTRRCTETTTTISATSTNQTTPVGGKGKTHKDFMRAMRNCCYGCGAIDHNKAQGNYSQEQCHHCKHFGHHTSVCQDKLLKGMPGLGLKPARVVKTNSVVPFTLFPGETVNNGASPPAPTAIIASSIPSAPVSASYTPSSDAVACIATLQDSLNQQNVIIQQLMGQKNF
ncbi:hypothetical protein PQX77_013900 [Marasmius sp. AFHP31]|nr:hypothetical protein PQX77_013900 [Marasmius sp. AFHP31]